MSRSLLALPLCLLVLASCGEDGPLMKPGYDCLSCHGSSSGGGTRHGGFSVAGTVFSRPDDSENGGVDGVTILITDATGKQITLTSNAAGNFYTSETVTFPINAQLQHGSTVVKMQQAVPVGACSSCHTIPPTGSAPGRNYIQ